MASVRSSRVAADRSAVAVPVFIRRDTALSSFPSGLAAVGSPRRFFRSLERVARARARACERERRRRRHRCHRRPVSAICTSRGVHSGRNVGEAAGSAARQRVLVKSGASPILVQSVVADRRRRDSSGPTIPRRSPSEADRAECLHLRYS